MDIMKITNSDIVYVKEKEPAIISLVNGLKFEYDRIMYVDSRGYYKDDFDDKFDNNIFMSIIAEKIEGHKVIKESLIIRRDQIAFISNPVRKNKIKIRYKLLIWAYDGWRKHRPYFIVSREIKKRREESLKNKKENIN